MERYDRQQLIAEWNQEILERSRLTIVGNNSFSSFLSLSAAALGLGKQRILYSGKISPKGLNCNKIARSINLSFSCPSVETFLVSKSQRGFFDDSDILVDATNYGLSKKISLEWLFQEETKKGIFVRPEQNQVHIYTYHKGRENENLVSVMPENHFPRESKIDPVLGIVAAGIALEEIKNALMNREVSPHVINYTTSKRTDSYRESYKNRRALVVGAGALGNFVALCLNQIGAGNVDIIDPDIIDETNLNRQIIFYNAVGKEKASVLAKRLSGRNRVYRGIVDKFTYNTYIKDYDTIFDCVDNFETRIVLSEKCEKEKIPLISGGTSYTAGQVSVYFPLHTEPPHKILGLEEIVERRREEQARIAAGCLYQPDPSVIMSNQIIGGIMVNEFRKLCFPSLYEQPIINGFIRYDAEDPARIQKQEINLS